MAMTHIHANIEVRCQLVQKMKWKQTDGRTDGHMTDRIAFPTNAVDNYATRTERDVTCAKTPRTARPSLSFKDVVTSLYLSLK